MIDPSEIDQATLDTLLRGIMTTYGLSLEDSEDILSDVMLKLVIWYKNNKDTDKYPDSSMRMAIPFIKRAIHNRVIDDRIRYYTQGRQQYRKTLDQLKEDISSGYSHQNSLAWGLEMDDEGIAQPIIPENIQRWLGGLTDAQATAVLGRHVLELSRPELVESYPELFNSSSAVSEATSTGLEYLRTKAAEEDYHGTE